MGEKQEAIIIQRDEPLMIDYSAITSARLVTELYEKGCERGQPLAEFGFSTEKKAGGQRATNKLGKGHRASVNGQRSKVKCNLLTDSGQAAIVGSREHGQGSGASDRKGVVDSVAASSLVASGVAAKPREHILGCQSVAFAAGLANRQQRGCRRTPTGDFLAQQPGCLCERGRIDRNHRLQWA